MCVHRVALGGAVPAYLVTAHPRTRHIRHIFDLFYRLIDIQPGKIIAIDFMSCGASNEV
jgi:hypothetical protein